MADELDQALQEPSESQKRINQLSKEKKEASEAREVALQGQREAEEKAAAAEKKAAFADSFADIVSTNPAAKDFKADIEAKVMSGYTPEDAAYAVLGKAGKLNQPKVEPQMSAAGGSASTNLPTEGVEKSVAEMTQAERREELAKRADLYEILAPRSNK